MTLSFKGTICAFAVLICMSAAQLLYLSISPSGIKTELTKQQYQQDIALFLNAINQYSAFAALKPASLESITRASQKLAKTAPQLSQTIELEHVLQSIISQLNDPGASVTRPAVNESALLLPLTLRFDGQNWHALSVSGNEPSEINKSEKINELDKANHSAIAQELDLDFPYITHIDGLPLQRWVIASQAYLADSVKLSSAAQVHWLQQISKLRQDIGLPHKTDSIITLSNGDNHIQRTVKLTRAITHPAAITKQLHSPETRSLESQIAHKLIHLNDNIAPSTLNVLTELLAKPIAPNTQPLAIDIRAIKQPQPQLMAWLKMHFGQPKQQQTIGVLQYKRHSHSRAEQLPKHFTALNKLNFFEQTNLINQGFDNQLKQSTALSDFQARLHIAPKKKTKPKISAQTKAATSEQVQLSLLIDSDCEQECEWIALAAQKWPNVELVGSTTRGSLSPRYKVTLPHSGIELELSTGIVYGADGQLISGIGIAPAIQLHQFAFEDSNVGAIILAQKLNRSLAPLKGTVAVATTEKR
ncbi:S41 family peptidase [Shewanella pneumatophori]|uniref:S41 family peptidase n=1 Tax=Shewanella pneumatophori TaxID=314092 RepID=A0A9X2CC51_9GAMM|nr:S41 family peptidase [Shewanella pneumatophori]MCL1137628.1 S41 family peptidase [Shewanella pneumatophori]